ncbi:MAG: acetylxylan esterase [Pirellula sp.]
MTNLERLKLPVPLTRRDLMTATTRLGALSLVVPFANPAHGQSQYSTLNRYPRMLHDWYVAQVQKMEDQHKKTINALNSKADAERYVATAREKIRKCFGPEPERTPLRPRVTGVVERETYRIEKLIFESRPNFFVTANVYVPTNAPGPFPAVVGTCGHSNNGKAAEAYQSFAQGLVKLGYVCLIYDPIGQGERLQYSVDRTTSKIGVGVLEHLHAGNQQFLVGDFLGAWHAWDGIRALDYLMTRSEVDATRIGVTGNSGGGTLTTWLCGLEQRWAMAAPACFVTSFRRNLENELPADTEQCPPLALALGLDHGDFLAAMAPKPIIILAKERDYFDVRGSEETYQRLKKLYSLLGAPDNIALFVGPTEHGYSQENREAMYSWFHLSAGIKASSSLLQEKLNGQLSSSAVIPSVREPKLTIETDETLRCTVSGQVSENPNVSTVFASTRGKSRQLSSERQPLRHEGLAQAIRRGLQLATIPTEAPDYRIWQHLGSRGYASRSGVAYAVATEPGIEAIVYQLLSERRMSRPAKSDRTAALYLPDFSSDEELRSEKMLRDMSTDKSLDVFTCDARGVGESQPDTCGPNSFRKPYGSEYFYSIHGLMLGRSLLGQRTWDVLRVLQWIETLGYSAVHLAGLGRGALVATMVATLSPIVKKVVLKKSIESWSAIAETEYYELSLSSIPLNVLSEFDLPDCYRELESKGLQRIE